MNSNDSIFKFLEAIPDVMELGKLYTAPCPFCDGTIRAIRSVNNGHLSAQCDKCGRRVKE